MKALVTAGGRGTRLRPITHTLNKHLIPLANKPMIFYALEKIAELGIKEVGIVINEGDKELPTAIGNGDKFGLRITYIQQTGGPLGLGHVVKVSQSFIGADPFLFYLGDNILRGSLKPLMEEFQKNQVNCQLALAKVPDPQRFGVPEIRDGRIVGVQEKPSIPKSEFAVTGVYIYDHHIFEAVSALQPSSRGELEISDAHQYLLDHGYKIGFKEITSWWKDTGKPQDLLEGNSLMLADIQGHCYGDVDTSCQIFGQVQIGRKTKISQHTVIRGPVSIGDGCDISDSYIGPYTSIGNNVTIKNTEIEHSLILDGASIECPTRIVNSLMGMNCTIGASKISRPFGHKFVIGDNTSVEIVK